MSPNVNIQEHCKMAIFQYDNNLYLPLGFLFAQLLIMDFRLYSSSIDEYTEEDIISISRVKIYCTKTCHSDETSWLAQINITNIVLEIGSYGYILAYFQPGQSCKCSQLILSFNLLRLHAISDLEQKKDGPFQIFPLKLFQQAITNLQGMDLYSL